MRLSFIIKMAGSCFNISRWIGLCVIFSLISLTGLLLALVMRCDKRNLGGLDPDPYAGAYTGFFIGVALLPFYVSILILVRCGTCSQWYKDEEQNLITTESVDIIKNNEESNYYESALDSTSRAFHPRQLFQECHLPIPVSNDGRH